MSMQGIKFRKLKKNRAVEQSSADLNHQTTVVVSVELPNSHHHPPPSAFVFLSFPKQKSTENIVKKSGQMSGLEGDQMAA